MSNIKILEGNILDVANLECVRSWRLCASEAVCGRIPDKTTSLKVYRDGHNIYIAGDYLGLGGFAYKENVRNLHMSLQILEDKQYNIPSVIEQDMGLAGEFSFKEIQDTLLSNTGCKVIKSKFQNKCLVERLKLVKDACNKGNLFILKDTFPEYIFLDLEQLLNELLIFNRFNIQRDKGLMFALATGVNYLFNKGENKMKLHNKLQQVDLYTLGNFAQRVTSNDYTLEDLDIVLDHEYIDEGCLVERLGEVGMLIQRTCNESVGFTLDDIISILDSKVTKEPDDTTIVKYKVDIHFNDAIKKVKELRTELQGDISITPVVS